jgi:hypothetical protein
MRKGRRPRIAVLGVLAACAIACAQAPQLEFVPDEAGSGSPAPPEREGGAPDATLGNVDAAPAGGDDSSQGPEDDSAASGDDASPFIDPGDDAGPDAAIGCNGTVVANCALCMDAPIRCKRGGVDQCVADCTACGPDTLPCFHCPTPTARPRGNCVRVDKAGQVACTKTNLCACSTPADCTPAEGAARTCVMDPSADAGRCLTCGTPGTGSDVCEDADGGIGHCRIQAGGPVCK